MDLRHLEYFVAVAEERNFSNAAKRLRIAQPPLSMQIKKLEEELGVQLFERLSRGVNLTAVGKNFLVDARAVLDRAKQARTNLDMAITGAVGTISIGVIPTIVNEQLAGFLREFRNRHPKVIIDIHEMHSSDQIRALLDDKLDVGFLRAPVNEPVLEHRFVSVEPMVLAVPSNHPLARLKRVDWKLLDGQPLVMLDTHHATCFNHQFLARCQEENVAPVVSQYAHTVHMKMWLVSAGFGIAPASESLRHITRPNLSFCDLPPDAPKLESVIAWKRTNPSPAVHNLVRIVEETLARTRP